ncbi:paramecium surface antigen repeat-containing protein [Cavenderia fasciculata]|uniref:Paramecium surface antigen repeat-containing protein n=1 Tax=Cavenderia fasciculata TaxID=261658 RepID=F4PN80_CACFS|nr:paramecium surface antigen repeat-containing protein [Cavenderia fasciculata]EGG22933.1 paramecium surface antigen repeat-containing protein [Cavenderia fasciculata]|eukprot:XP_004360784.1 paramecium surface antigen repeat-containing protein [Cavenderia fasciculata]
MKLLLYVSLVIVAIIVISFTSFARADQCKEYVPIAKCVGEGDQCSQDVPCQGLLYCDNEGNSIHNGTCVKYAELDEDCSKVQCNPIYTCLADTCVIANYAQRNESCQHDYECMGDMTCVESVCSLIGSCKQNIECPFGTSCDNNGLCTDNIKAGELLPKKGDQYCAIGTKATSQGYCVSLYSLAVDQDCDDDTFCDDQLVCSGGKCSALPKATPTSVNCLSSPCTSYEECVCQGGDASATNATCYSKGLFGSALEQQKTTYLEFLNCITIYKCVIESNTDSPIYNSCAEKNCVPQYCTFLNSSQITQVYNPLPESCHSQSPICLAEANSSSSIQVNYISLILILSIFILFTFF